MKIDKAEDEVIVRVGDAALERMGLRNWSMLAAAVFVLFTYKDF